MKTNSNNTLRLTRIIRNGIALTVAVLGVNSLQAQPATQDNTPSTTQNEPASPPTTPRAQQDPAGQNGTANNNSTSTTQNEPASPPTTPRAQQDTSANGAPVAGVPTNPNSDINNNNNGTYANIEKTSHRAKEFIKDAAQANSSEIALSELAQSKAMNSDVKQLAQMMVNDHQQNLQKLQGVAQARGVAVDQSLDWVNQHEVNRLQKAKEGDFDKDYTKLMLKDHVKAIKMFTKAADDVKEQDVKEYAANTLPKLREHLRHVEDAARAAGLDDSTVNSIVKDVPAGGTN